MLKMNNRPRQPTMGEIARSTKVSREYRCEIRDGVPPGISEFLTIDTEVAEETAA